MATNVRQKGNFAAFDSDVEVAGRNGGAGRRDLSGKKERGADSARRRSGSPAANVLFGGGVGWHGRRKNEAESSASYDYY